MKPRILILTTAYLPHIGGSELAAYHITERATDFEFDIITCRLSGDDATEEPIGRSRVYRAGGSWARRTFLLPKLLAPLAITLTGMRLMRANRYVAIHAYQASQAAFAGLFLKLAYPTIPFVVTLQEGKDLDRQSWLTRHSRELILRSATAITAISTYLADYARRLVRTPVHIIPNGVDVASMKLPDVEREPNMVLTVSRLVEKNNVVGLIRAMPLVRARVPDAQLVVVGTGPLLDDLKLLVTDLQLAGIVEFVGAVHHTELGTWLAQAAVFARPSLSEGLGSAFLEAMAAGTPVVASPVGGIPDIIHHAVTGMLCDPHNPESIADAIVQLLVDRPLRDSIVAESLRMVRTKYDWTMIAHTMERLYHDVARQ